MLSRLGPLLLAASLGTACISCRNPLEHDISLTAEVFVAEVRANPVAARQRYERARVKVDGRIDSIETWGGQDQVILGALYLRFASEQENVVASMEPGNRVVAVCSWGGSNPSIRPTLVDCYRSELHAR